TSGLAGIPVADGSVTLSPGGTWRARTSCEVLGNDGGGGGAYRLLSTGSLLVTEGAIGGTGCNPPEQAPPADATAILDFFKARSMTIIGSHMTVYDRDGHRL